MELNRMTTLKSLTIVSNKQQIAKEINCDDTSSASLIVSWVICSNYFIAYMIPIKSDTFEHNAARRRRMHHASLLQNKVSVKTPKVQNFMNRFNCWCFVDGWELNYRIAFSQPKKELQSKRDDPLNCVVRVFNMKRAEHLDDGSSH